MEAGTGRFEFPEDGEHWTTIWTGELFTSVRKSAALATAAALALGGWGVGTAALEAVLNAYHFPIAIDNCSNPLARVAHVWSTRFFRRHVGIEFRAAAVTGCELL